MELRSHKLIKKKKRTEQNTAQQQQNTVFQVHMGHYQDRLDVKPQIKSPQRDDVRNQKIKQKFISLWKLDNTFLNNQLMKEEITREIRKLLEDINENKPQYFKTYGTQ